MGSTTYQNEDKQGVFGVWPLNIGRTSRNYCKFNNTIPPLIGLTGTASRAVLKDVQRELQIDDFNAIITPQSFNRPELKFSVIHASSDEKMARMLGYLTKSLPDLFNATSAKFYGNNEENTYSGLLFCPHVNGDFGVVHISEEINHELGINSAPYSGGKPKNWGQGSHSEYKQKLARDYKRNMIPLLVCTNAFGMGIDKSNIRYTIHYNIPPSIEAFYQEAGRAGRNRKTAYCSIIISNDDPKRTEALLNENTSVEDISNAVKNIWETSDDITRRLYFHTQAFRGISQEKRDIEEIIGKLGDISRSRKETVTIPEIILDFTRDIAQARTITEKALHRLLLVGIISDYTIDYNLNEFHVKLAGLSKEEIIETYGKYIAGYHQGRSDKEVAETTSLLHLSLVDFTIGIIDRLLHFIYDVIERGRRRALHEMLLTCSVSSKDKDIRKRILQYLEETEYSKSLEELLSANEVGIKEAKDIIASLCSPNEAAELRGQVARYLGSIPDHPSLLILRSVSEALSRDRKKDVVIDNFIAAVASALTKYGVKRNILFDFISWTMLSIMRADNNLAKVLLQKLFENYPDRYFAKNIIQELPIDFLEVPAWYLLHELQKDCAQLIKHS